jgi:DDE superfamily endonuclease
VVPGEEAVAVVASMAQGGLAGGVCGDEGVAVGVLAGFRRDVYWSLTRRADALFGLCDAVLCGPGRVRDLARLSLVPEFGRGHGALYDALNAGHAGIGRLRRALAGLPLPVWPDGGIRLAVDVSSWLRPDAVTSPERLLCHVSGRGKNAGQVVPGWPYSFVAVLGPGASSWTVLLDAVRLGPEDDQCAVTAGQLREVFARLEAAGQWVPGDPPVIIAMDAGYNVTRLAYLLAGLPVVLIARVRSDRVFWRAPGPKARGLSGRHARHGAPVRCADPAAQDGAVVEQQGQARVGPVRAAAWTRVHQVVHRHTGGFQDWPADRPLPVIEGTLIRLAVTAPGRRPGAVMWLWASTPDAGDDQVRALWQAYLRRFDIEHTFRFLKQQLGWTRPLLRDPAAADRWTWLLICCFAQLWLARDLAAVTRLPWQPRQPPGAMTPARVRAGFPRARQAAGTPARTAKPGKPGPGRPRGSKNRHKAPRHRPGKTTRKQPKQAKNPRKKASQTG